MKKWEDDRNGERITWINQLSKGEAGTGYSLVNS